MDSLVVFSPAKLNLFLAVTGRRADGFHELASLVVPLAFGDKLEIRRARDGEFTLTCNRPDVPVDERNLVLRAARAFVARTGWRGGASFALQKRIPVGAGLGGGSSNAAAALRTLNRLAGEPLTATALAEVAAEVGSDCPLFLHGPPLVMRGRGERIDPLPRSATDRLLGRRVLVFKPAFGIETAWAYRRLAELAAEPGGDPVYLPTGDADTRLDQWVRNPSTPAEALLFNSLETPAFGKFIALPALLRRLREQYGWTARLSGSGSACFGLLAEDTPVEALQATIREAWGDTAWQVVTTIGVAPADPS